ncbi:MAG: hypothetical protein Cons2KO_26270 [Congregibacter sp.]
MLACAVSVLIAGSSETNRWESPYDLAQFKTLYASSHEGELMLGYFLSFFRDALGESEGAAVSPTAIDFLERAMVLHPSNQFVLQTALNVCQKVKHQNLRLCQANIEETLVDLDTSNGIYEWQLAARQFREGQSVRALQSMQRAADADQMSIRWEVQSHALSDATERVSGARRIRNDDVILWIIGFAAQNLPRVSPLFEVCRAELSDAEWRQACLDVGRAMEDKGSTVIAVKVGMALQRVIYEDSQKASELAALESREKALSDLTSKTVGLDVCDVTANTDFRTYFDRLLAFGEIGMLSDCYTKSGYVN